MLTKVIVENFKSFKDKTTFDLGALKYQILQDTNVCNGILKGALLVGPNATGKSTLILAIKKLLDLLFSDNTTIDPFDFCLFCHKSNIHLEYHFLINGENIQYAFETDKKGHIVFEELLLSGNKVIERKLSSGNVYLGDETTKIMDKLFSSRVLMLRKCYFADFFASMPTIVELMEFLRTSVYVDASRGLVSSYNNASLLIQNADENLLNEINSSFKTLNIGFKISKSKENKISEVYNKQGNVQAYTLKANKPIIFFQRDDMKLNLPLELESLGNQTLINLFPSVLHCSQHNSLLLIDEFSSGFHNKLEELVIKYFLLNSKSSQVIFTSHSTNLLNTRLLRPDQIYTVDFKPNDGSFIERFSDENPREAQNLEKMYLSGKFGSLPKYNI